MHHITTGDTTWRALFSICRSEDFECVFSYPFDKRWSRWWYPSYPEDLAPVLSPPPNWNPLTLRIQPLIIFNTLITMCIHLKNPKALLPCIPNKGWRQSQSLDSSTKQNKTKQCLTVGSNFARKKDAFQNVKDWFLWVGAVDVFLYHLKCPPLTQISQVPQIITCHCSEDSVWTQNASLQPQSSCVFSWWTSFVRDRTFGRWGSQAAWSLCFALISSHLPFWGSYE